MSGGEVRKVTPQDIQMVQNLIEQCLPYYMTQKEVTKLLLDEKKIEPTFTELVWQRLEQQNQEFFRAYQMRMMLKEQITEFNKLLQKQAVLMKQVTRRVSLASISNGSHLQPRNQSAAYYAQGNSGPALGTEHMQQHATTNLPGAFTNYGSSISPGMRSGLDMSVHSRRIDVSSNIRVLQNSNVGMARGINGEMINSEAGYDSRFMQGAGSNVLETHTAIGDTSVSSFSSIESDSQPMNESPFDDMSSLGLLENYGISDLADFAHSSGLLDSYSGSPFRENLLESQGGIKEHHGGNMRLETTQHPRA